MKINNLTADGPILKLNAGIHFLTGVPKCTPLFFAFVEYR